MNDVRAPGVGRREADGGAYAYMSLATATYAQR
jgi:hypothetical protein